MNKVKSTECLDCGKMHLGEAVYDKNCSACGGLLKIPNDEADVTTQHNSYQAAPTGAQREKLTEVYDLFPFEETVQAYTRVAEFGAKKYSPWNWSKGLPKVQLIASLLRHAFALLRGETHDKDSGLSHADHILWNAVAISHNEFHNLENGIRAEPPRDYKK